MGEPDSAIQSTALPGRALGDYVILAELARGGMGRVYLARKSGQAGFARLFAIKVMSHHLEDDREALLMLLDEAHIASRLHHPNVVSVLDIGTADGGYYLVMDYVEGGSLHELLRRHQGPRPVPIVVSILLEALQGLHAVHSLADGEGQPYGVVHRDVSPHNLLVGLDGACRVIDFGIAKASARFTDTQAGVHKGKLAYMAPEQMRGATDLDRRVDVWAAGVTLYAGMTGHHPFRSSNDASTIHNVLHAEIPLPSTHGAPACFDAIVMKALERDPNDRYGSARELGDALRAVALREGLLVSPSDVAAWVSELVGDDLSKRRRMIHSVASVDSITRSGSVPIPRLWTAPESTGSGSSGARPASAAVVPRRSSRAPWIGALALGLVLGVVGLVLSSQASEANEADAVPSAWHAASSVPETRVPEGPASADAPSAGAVGIAAPVPARAAAPTEPTSATEPAEPTEPTEPTSATAAPRAAPRGPAWRRRALSREAHAPVEPALAEEHAATTTAVAPPPAPAPAPAPAAAPAQAAAPAPPPPATRTLESNPYMRGE